ncbi:hypothetical protein ACPCK9_32205 [Streptomyces koyangensis]|uniref:hypothetical protein n=1 Tax=Streptomyces koyangensis TaxID=188770 RepID=UPI003C2D8244
MTRRIKTFYASVGTLTAALLVLGGVMWIGGEEGVPEEGKPSASASRKPGAVQTFTPQPDWVEPDRWVALPRPEETDEAGLGVKFEAEELGAVAMLVAQQTYVAEGKNTVFARQMDIYRAYFSAADRLPEREGVVREGRKRADAKVRQMMGLPAEGDYPPGASVSSRVKGFKVYHSEEGKVGAYLLTVSSYRAGETEREQVAYTIAPLVAVWEAGDWKVSSKAIQRLEPVRKMNPVPKAATVGDTRFNTEGWTAIREAS